MTGPIVFHRSVWKPLLLLGVFALALTATGCAWSKRQLTVNKPVPATRTPAAQPLKTIVTPDISLLAKVVSVNPVGRFVVLNFPSGEFPRLQQTLFLYRGGLKTGEVRVTGPKVEMDNNIVADLVSGEAQAGDTVRSE